MQLEILDNATNGDVLKSLFPKGLCDRECDREQNVVSFDINIRDDKWFLSLFDKEWWDAPYKKVKD